MGLTLVLAKPRLLMVVVKMEQKAADLSKVLLKDVDLQMETVTAADSMMAVVFVMAAVFAMELGSRLELENYSVMEILGLQSDNLQDCELREKAKLPVPNRSYRRQLGSQKLLPKQLIQLLMT